MTNPAAETKSIGLPADAQLSWFLHRRLDSFIVTGQILPVYRDFATLTVSPGRENLRPFTGTVQKLMPTLTQTATSHTTGPLGFIGGALNDNDRKTEVNAVIKMEEGPPQVLYRRDLQTTLRCFPGDWAVLNS